MVVSEAQSIILRRNRERRSPALRRVYSVILIGICLLCVTEVAAAQILPARISDAAFWRMITDYSEADGYFPYENFVSNEDAFLTVISYLKQTVKADGVYFGVGPEQNFTYINAVHPRMAFIVDIRRQNMLEHLFYKAIFELSIDRADFLSRLFCRKTPEGLNTNST